MSVKLSTSESKKCTKCGVEKPHADFHKDKAKKDGLKSRCKSCRAAYSMANREHRAEYLAEYREANKERIAEKQAEYREANKERIAEYRKANKDRRLAYKAERRAKKKNAAVDLTDNERLAIRLIYEDAQTLGWHVDHIVPISKGGLHHPDNLQIVRPSYNLQKNDKIFAKRKYL